MKRTALWMTLVLALAGCTQSVSQVAGEGDGPPESAEIAPALAPGDAMQMEAPAASGPDAPLKVIDYRPQGSAPASSEISVRFNQPVVALTGAAEASAEGLLTFDPPIKGRPALPMSRVLTIAVEDYGRQIAVARWGRGGSHLCRQRCLGYRPCQASVTRA